MRAFVLAAGLLVSSFAAAAESPIRFSPLGEPGCGGAIVSLEINPHDGKHLISGGDMLGVATSFDGGDSWQSTFGFASYEMATPTFSPTDPNVVWIGSCMGPYKSSDRGIHWVERRTGMPAPSTSGYSAIVEKVLFDPDQPKRLLAVGGSSRRWNKSDAFGWIWESTDDGESWKPLVTLTPDGAKAELIKGANIVWAAYEPKSAATLHALLDGGTWLKSMDDGRSWAVQSPAGLAGTIHAITYVPSDPSIVYVSTQASATGPTPGGVFKSTDGGRTFAPSDRGIHKTISEPFDANTTSHFSNVVVGPDPNVLYVCDRAWTASVVYQSVDAGANWTAVVTKQPVGQTQKVGDLSKAFRIRTAAYAGLSVHLAIDPNDASRVYGYNTEFVIRSVDAGKTWDDATAYNPDSAKPDAWRGRGWNGWCSNEVRFNPFKPDQLIVQAMDAGRAWISDDNGNSWRYAQTDVHPWLGGNAVAFTKDGRIYGTTGQFAQVNGITRSRDGGATWESLAGKERGLPGKGWGNKGSMGGIYAHPDRSSEVWAVVNGRILFTSDGGETWSPVSETGFSWLEGDLSRPGRFYASAKDGIYVTDDGKRFTNIGGPKPVNRSKLHVDSRGRLYAAQWREGDAGVWRFDPGNSSWARLIDDAMAIDVATDPKDPTRIVLVTSMDPYFDRAGGNGVWISADDGKNWSREIEGLPMLRAKCVEFDPKNGERFVVGTYGRGFFHATWPREYKPVGTRAYVHTDADTRSAKRTVANDKPTSALRNGSFEQGDAAPWNWQPSGVAKIARDTTIFKQGAASLKVTVDGGDGHGLQRLELKAGDKLRVSGFVRSSGDVKVNACVMSFKPNSNFIRFDQLKYTQGNSDWATFDKTITLPAETDFVQVGVMVSGTGSAWIDDYKVEINGAPAVAEATKPQANATGEQAPAKGLPNTAAPGFYPAYPTAWKQTFKGQLERVKKGGIDIVLLGDSITQGWGDTSKGPWKDAFPDLKTVNFGIGGDSTRQVMYRIENGLLDGYSPRLIVLKIGTNNLYSDFNSGSDAQIAEGIKACVELILKKQPNSKLLLLSILPRQNDYFNRRINNVNGAISKLGDGDHVHYLDINGAFKVSDKQVIKELFQKDELHLAAPGYDKFFEQLQPKAKELAKP